MESFFSGWKASGIDIEARTASARLPRFMTTGRRALRSAATHRKGTNRRSKSSPAAADAGASRPVRAMSIWVEEISPRGSSSLRRPSCSVKPIWAVMAAGTLPISR